MLNLFLAGFAAAIIALGLRRPFIWVLFYLYVDIVAPQKISTGFLASMPISLIAFVLAVTSWLIFDRKDHSRFTHRQVLMVFLLAYCAMTTMYADFPVHAAAKWDWVWKALVFAIFVPLTLRTRLRIEGAALVMVLSAGAIVIDGAIKTLLTGGGYGSMQLFVNDNTGLYEGSIISCVAVAIVPVILWLARHGTVFPPDWRVKLFAAGLAFACLLIPVGTQARTGLLCIGLLGILLLRTVKHRMIYIMLVAAAGMAALPLLPDSYTKRMDTIENHQADESASTRIAVWKWTLAYAADHPLGGGFDAYRQNKLHIELRSVTGSGGNSSVDESEVQDQGRAYHSSYFEMLGEQGWPGLILWLWLQIAGIWQMEKINRRWRGRTGPGEQWQAPLAIALQQAQLIYLLGAAFVGIAYQPFILMLIGLQCGLWSYVKRIEVNRIEAGEPRARLGAVRPGPAARPSASSGVARLGPPGSA